VEKSDLVSAVAHRSELSEPDAASAVEFVFQVLSADRHPSEPDRTDEVNASLPLLAYLDLDLPRDR